MGDCVVKGCNKLAVVGDPSCWLHNKKVCRCGEKLKSHYWNGMIIIDGVSSFCSVDDMNFNILPNHQGKKFKYA